MSTLNESAENNAEAADLRVRCIIQQCLKAKLQTRLSDPENNIEAEHVQVRIFIFMNMNFSYLFTIHSH